MQNRNIFTPRKKSSFELEFDELYENIDENESENENNIEGKELNYVATQQEYQSWLQKLKPTFSENESKIQFQNLNVKPQYTNSLCEIKQQSPSVIKNTLQENNFCCKI